jgi:tRNA dimethylallyltransferase
MDREKLGERISARVDQMWKAGFIDEVDALLNAGITDGRTAQLALGYSQIIAFRNGLMSQDEAREDTKRATRQYARRQETWFSRDARITWISPVQPRLERVLAHLEKINLP